MMWVITVQSLYFFFSKIKKTEFVLNGINYFIEFNKKLTTILFSIIINKRLRVY